MAITSPAHSSLSPAGRPASFILQKSIFVIDQNHKILYAPTTLNRAENGGSSHSESFGIESVKKSSERSMPIARSLHQLPVSVVFSRLQHHGDRDIPLS
jgi:hypothetical protein